MLKQKIIVEKNRILAQATDLDKAQRALRQLTSSNRIEDREVRQTIQLARQTMMQTVKVLNGLFQAPAVISMPEMPDPDDATDETGIPEPARDPD